MRTTATVHPENDLISSTERGVHDNINQRRNIRQNCRPTGRCIRLVFLIIVFVFMVFALIGIPLIVSRTRDSGGEQLQPDTMATTNDSYSSATMSSIDVTTKASITFTDSSIANADSILPLTTISRASASSTIAGTDESPTSTDTSMTISYNDDVSTESNMIFHSQTDNTVVTMTPTITISDATISSTSTVTTATMAMRPIVFLNRKGDHIIGLYNTTAGHSTGGFDGMYRTKERPDFVMDNLTNTKYFNNGKKYDSINTTHKYGIGTGFLVIPTIGKSTVACSLLFATANDKSERDPINVTLEGSNATDLGTLHNGTSWTLIYTGPTGIDASKDSAREQYGTQQNFSNTKPFASYRLLVTALRASADAAQYSEARIIGYVWT